MSAPLADLPCGALPWPWTAETRSPDAWATRTAPEADWAPAEPEESE